MMVILLLGMEFMFSRVYRNRICTAAFMSRMSDASRYSLAHYRSAEAEIMFACTALLVLDTILRFSLSSPESLMSLSMICSTWTPQLSHIFSTYCAILSLTSTLLMSRSCKT